jgi:hypothetical protein
MKRKIGGLVAGIFATLVVAAPAQAAPISFDYCELTLRGQAALAPDNDIKEFWDSYEVITGFNITSSSRVSSYRRNDQSVQLQFAFRNAQGVTLTYKSFSCWRTGYVPSGEYHDGPVAA